MTFSLKAIFQRDERYEGVRRINIYLLRLLYILMFFVLGKSAVAYSCGVSSMDKPAVRKSTGVFQWRPLS